MGEEGLSQEGGLGVGGETPRDRVLDVHAIIKEQEPLERYELIALHPADKRALVSAILDAVPSPDRQTVLGWAYGDSPNTYAGLILEADAFVPRGQAKCYEKAADYREEVEERKRWFRRRRN